MNLQKKHPEEDQILMISGLILLFSSTPPWASNYVKDVKSYFEEWQFVAICFMISMKVWNMPIFLFLSGISAFIIFWVHHILIPALFLSLVTQVPLSTRFLLLSAKTAKHTKGNILKTTACYGSIAWSFLRMIPFHHICSWCPPSLVSCVPLHLLTNVGSRLLHLAPSASGNTNVGLLQETILNMG